MVSCKKDTAISNDTQVEDMDEQLSAEASTAELWADSVFLYAKTVYLWNTQLPTYQVFNPRQYVNIGDVTSGIESELLAITSYAVNEETGQSYEYDEYDASVPKYSYLDASESEGALAGVPKGRSLVDMDGEANDIGLLVGAYGSSNTNYTVYVQVVFDGSPAAKAGLKRGDRITTINGTGIGSNFNAEYELIYNAFYGTGTSTVALKGYRQDGASFSVSLSRSAYQPSVVLADSVYRYAGHNIGYLAFYQFNSLADAKADLDLVFDRFSGDGVDQLIVDLRYNGGGYVATAEYLCNLIAPASANGKTMYSERFNETMQAGDIAILKNQQVEGSRLTYADYDYSLEANTFPFEKTRGPSAISSVVFIVTGNTASASELLINALKPYVTVKLVGTTTYGKPVGFFPIKIGDYEIYYSMFETANAENAGGYYGGMETDYEELDDPRYDFGDLGESSLAAAYAYLTRGSFTASTVSRSSASAEVLSGSDSFQTLKTVGSFLSPAFKGMVEDRRR